MLRLVIQRGLDFCSSGAWAIAAIGLKVVFSLSPLTFIIFVVRDNPSADAKGIAFSSIPFVILSFLVFYSIKRLCLPPK